MRWDKTGLGRWVFGLAVIVLMQFPSVARGQSGLGGGTSPVPVTPAVPAGASSAVAPTNQPEQINPGAGPVQGASQSPASFTGATLSQLPDLTKRENIAPAMQIIVLLTVLSLAPSILLMMTCFTRIVIVLSLLRQALGTQQLPPNQVLVGLALFMTFVVMGPTIADVNNNAVQPYLNPAKGVMPLSQSDAIDRAIVPARRFMINQMEAAGNAADVDLFTDFAHLPRAKRWSDVPTLSLVPAFILSELKTAFLIGFKIYLPFLVIDMVISAILISMGMMMLPPAMISLPFKLLLFVLVNGWHLVCASLMASFVT